jgi:hypothetical protein
VNFYAAAFQGTTTAANGQSSKVTVSALQNATDVETESEMPGGFTLHQNYPNPFNPTTAIRYQLSAVNHVTLKVFDLLGGEVTTLVNEWQAIGSYSVRFDGSGLASGVYVYQLQAGNFKDTKKLVLLR